MNNVNKRKVARIGELDALRGLAALSVVLFHYTFGYDYGLKIMNDNHFYFRYGNLGVQLFFMISGFVIFMTLEHIKTPKDFLISRFSRLYPAYWFAIFLIILITKILNVPFQQNIYTVKQVVVNLTMMQHWFKVKDVDGAFWTLAVELTFYVLMFIIYISKRLNKIVLYSFIWLFLTVFFNSFNLPFGKYVKFLLVLEHAPLFVAGIGFYLLYKKQKTIIIFSLIVTSFFVEIYMLSLSPAMSKSIIPYVCVAGFYIIFYVMINNKLAFLKHSFFVFFGGISYSLYLIHENIGAAIIFHLKKFCASQLFYIPITMMIVIGMAWLISIFIEKPTLTFIRNRFK